MTVREILDAIHALPRPDRLRLVEQLNNEALSDRLSPVSSSLRPPQCWSSSMVFTFTPDPSLIRRLIIVDDREAQIDHLIARLDAPRNGTSVIVAGALRASSFRPIRHRVSYRCRRVRV